MGIFNVFQTTAIMSFIKLQRKVKVDSSQIMFRDL